MTNKERQNKLDVSKWLESEKQGQDMSGKMDYCQKCGFADNGTCIIPASREADCDCARAYNKMKRAK